MKKYRVYGSVRVSVWTDVEAESEYEAKALADKEWSGLGNFVGNGGYSKLIGVYGENDGVEDTGSEPIWNEVEEYVSED